MGRPRIKKTKKLLPVPIRLLPETLRVVEAVAEAREWPTGKTIRKMVEAAIQANLVPPVKLPEAHNAATSQPPDTMEMAA